VGTAIDVVLARFLEAFGYTGVEEALPEDGKAAELSP
jgi:hypothetical protein